MEAENEAKVDEPFEEYVKQVEVKPLGFKACCLSK